jgi:hypothetical protein
LSKVIYKKDGRARVPVNYSSLRNIPASRPKMVHRRKNYKWSTSGASIDANTNTSHIVKSMDQIIYTVLHKYIKSL